MGAAKQDFVTKSKKLDIDFEETACEICNHTESKVVAERFDLLLGGKQIFQMHECLKCGSYYLNPRPTPTKMADFYPSDYQPFTVGVEKESFLNQYFRRYGLRKRFKIVKKYIPKGRLLDVGCATGDFLSEFKTDENWEGFGIEPSMSAASYAKENIGLEVLASTLNHAPFPDNKFDVLTMWDVLEHVYEPCKVLDEVARLLRPGGIFVVNHPNLDSIDRSIFGRFWAGFELPRHLYLFPTKLLEELMIERGFQQVERLCLYGSHAGTSTSFKFAIQHFTDRKHLEEFFARITLGKLARVLLLPYFKIIDLLKIGSNVTVVFKKQEVGEDFGVQKEPSHLPI